jgi:hypothetical protein
MGARGHWALTLWRSCRLATRGAGFRRCPTQPNLEPTAQLGRVDRLRCGPSSTTRPQARLVGGDGPYLLYRTAKRDVAQARNEISRLSEAASRSRDRPPNSAP